MKIIKVIFMNSIDRLRDGLIWVFTKSGLAGTVAYLSQVSLAKFQD
jgi:hypothetical protein